MSRLEVICGPMYAGKSEELMRRLRRDQIAGRNVLLIKPKIDERYSQTHVTSHNGVTMEAKIGVTASDIFWLGYGAAEVIGIDEIQFFEKDVVQAITDLLNEDKKIIVSGLDMTYRQEPFGDVPTLMAIADSVTKLSAVCHSCGEDAIYTQRLIGGEPAPFAGETVQVGGLDTYEARCRNCFRAA